MQKLTNKVYGYKIEVKYFIEGIALNSQLVDSFIADGHKSTICNQMIIYQYICETTKISYMSGFVSQAYGSDMNHLM